MSTLSPIQHALYPAKSKASVATNDTNPFASTDQADEILLYQGKPGSIQFRTTKYNLQNKHTGRWGKYVFISQDEVEPGERDRFLILQCPSSESVNKLNLEEAERQKIEKQKAIRAFEAQFAHLLPTLGLASRSIPTQNEELASSSQALKERRSQKALRGSKSYTQSNHNLRQNRTANTTKSREVLAPLLETTSQNPPINPSTIVSPFKSPAPTKNKRGIRVQSLMSSLERCWHNKSFSIRPKR